MQSSTENRANVHGLVVHSASHSDGGSTAFQSQGGLHADNDVITMSAVSVVMLAQSSAHLYGCVGRRSATSIDAGTQSSGRVFTCVCVPIHSPQISPTN